GLSDHSLVRLAINASNGTLTVAEAVDAGGRIPYGLAIHRSGLVVYVANQGSNNVAMFTSDPTTGALHLVRTASTGRGPSAVVVHPSGDYVYVANRDDNTISQYTWLLEPLAHATVVNGTTAAALTTDPDGKFLYGTNWQYGTVTMFSINPAN